MFINVTRISELRGCWERGNESSEAFFLIGELIASQDGRCFMNLDASWYFNYDVSGSLNACRWIVGCLVNNQLKECGRKWSWPDLRYKAEWATLIGKQAGSKQLWDKLMILARTVGPWTDIWTRHRFIRWYAKLWSQIVGMPRLLTHCVDHKAIACSPQTMHVT